MWRKWAVGLLCGLWLAHAGAVEMPFSTALFDAAMKAKAPVIVDFSAGWCPTCRVQRPIIAWLSSQPRYRKVLVLIAIYDLEKPLERSLHVVVQSTLVAFNGGREVGRSAGDISRPGLEALFNRAL